MDDSRHGFLGRLINEQGKGLRRYFRNRIRNNADIEELVQEVCLRLLTVKDPEAIRRPISYLYSVASNLLKEYRQRERRLVNFSDFDEKTANQLLGESPSLDSELEEIQILNRLYSAIERMPGKVRTAMTLKYLHGLTYSEIADAMRVSPSSVKKLLARGIARCLSEVLKYLSAARVAQCLPSAVKEGPIHEGLVDRLFRAVPEQLEESKRRAWVYEWLENLKRRLNQADSSLPVAIRYKSNGVRKGNGLSRSP